MTREHNQSFALENMVFLSNSVPKSGSTFLFSMQQMFLRGFVEGQKKCDYFEELRREGAEFRGSYVANFNDDAFLDTLKNGTRKNGPYVLKTHGLINDRIREVFLAEDHLQASLAVRDPLEIFFSATDNFVKSGEFPEFSKPEVGIETIVGYFSKIFRSVQITSQKKHIPIVRYEDIVSNPNQALISSLAPDIQSLLLQKVSLKALDVETASERASDRMNKGELKRDLSRYDPALVKDVCDGLEETRRMFGYV
ncbi:sulfotransferase family protein [Cognatishimia activa]|uniref:Sulfotransferase family protein n=1 Tax=Cognatishimia activa TaxID=1715691 RepID=A0A0P1IQP0_9RHOB|nr:sulfotransferase family protein [Cognatishimia activa]CUJ17283.1 hypothetical protein TA5113_02524 [Cognatishimia activa]CUK25838.1 hypothetical protein TA5114_01642 [Cognatishimia activa]